jgi:hypothetical protein
MKKNNGGNNKTNWIECSKINPKKRNLLFKKVENPALNYLRIIINSKIHMFTTKEMPICRNI